MCDDWVVSLFSSQGGVSWWLSSHGHSSVQAAPLRGTGQEESRNAPLQLISTLGLVRANRGCQLDWSWELDISGNSSKSSDHRVCRAFTSTSSGQGGASWAWLGSARVLQWKVTGFETGYTGCSALITLLISGSVWTLPAHNQLLHLVSWPKPAPVLTSLSRLVLIHSPEVSLPSIHPSVHPGLSCYVSQAIDKKIRLTNEFSIWPSCISY